MAKAVAGRNLRKPTSVENGKKGGRPKGAKNMVTADVRLLARQYGHEAMMELMRLAKHGKAEGTRVAAIKEILDRGYGRAPQPLTGEGGEGGITVVLRRFAGDWA